VGAGGATKSYNTGDVAATVTVKSYLINAYAGGIAGYTDSTVSETWNRGNITASIATTEDYSYVYAAGIVGFLSGGTVTKNAAANNSVTGSSTSYIHINRVLAAHSSTTPTIEHNFALDTMSVSGGTPAGDLKYKGTDKSASALKTKNTYSNDTSSDGLGWKFGNDDENPWTMPTPDGSAYPRLYWQTD
jgi:hypothetical protein